MHCGNCNKMMKIIKERFYGNSCFYWWKCEYCGWEQKTQDAK